MVRIEEEDWAEVLDLIRRRVAGGGFAAFDAAAFEAFHEDEEQLASRDVVLRYLDEFIAHQAVMYSKRRYRIGPELGEVLQDEGGRPVQSVEFVGEEGERPWRVPLDEIETSDQLIFDLRRLRDELADGLIREEGDLQGDR